MATSSRLDLSIAFGHDEAENKHNKKMLIGVLLGEGIGPQIINICLNLLQTIQTHTDLEFEIVFGGSIGKEAIAKKGVALTKEVIDFCQNIFNHSGAILCGPGGERFVYDLRKEFGLFCKLAPITSISALKNISIKQSVQANTVDILVIRENLGGVYQGKYGTELYPQTRAWQSFDYTESQIVDIVQIAINLAHQRSGKFTLVTKPGGIPTISALWENTAKRMALDANIEMNMLEIDNACYQMIANPEQFDILLSPNLFGDVLGDIGALHLGSRGMSYSANFSKGMQAAVYQTSHGAAHDLVGTNKANPIGQVLSLAMLLEQSFSCVEIADMIRASVNEVLLKNIRTPDLQEQSSIIVGTDEMGDLINQALILNFQNRYNQ